MALKYKFNPFTGKLDLIDEAGAAAGGNAYFTLVVAASDSVGTPTADYTCDGTDDEVQINAAITALGATGGTVMLLDGTFNLGATITMTSNVALRGNGNATIITVADTEASKFDFITADTINNIQLREFSINGKKGTIPVTPNQMIKIDKVTNWVVDSLYIHDVDDAGIFLDQNCYEWVISNCIFEEVDIGIELKTFVWSNGTISNCQFDGNSSQSPYGIKATSQTNGINITGCSFRETSSYPIDTGDASHDWTITGNRFENVGIALGSDEITVTGNSFYDISYDAVLCNGENNIISSNVFHKCGNLNDKVVRLFYATGCVVTGNIFHADGSTANTGILIDNSTENIITGNYLEGGWDTAAIVQTSSSRNIIKNNFGSNVNDEIDMRRMKNTSGGAMAIGDVVVLKSVAAGDEITTTTSAGNDLVFGIAAEAIADNAYGYVQTLGKTVTLTADGTAAIAVGDFLGTYTSAGVAQKAASGDMAIAIALEALASGSGTLDALIINPRKI